MIKQESHPWKRLAKNHARLCKNVKQMWKKKYKAWRSSKVNNCLGRRGEGHSGKEKNERQHILKWCKSALYEEKSS